MENFWQYCHFFSISMLIRTENAALAFLSRSIKRQMPVCKWHCGQVYYNRCQAVAEGR